MDLLLHLLGEQPEDAALTRDAALALEGGGDDDGPEVASTAGGARVAGVQVALVDHLHVVGREAFTELRLDVFASIHGRGRVARFGRGACTRVSWGRSLPHTRGVPGPEIQQIRRDVDALDWKALAPALEREGHVRIPRLLSARACAAMAALYADDARFRKTIDMGSHRYGEGEYRYFARPLPPQVEGLRRAFYPHLARVANRWNARWERQDRFEASLRGFLARCKAAGQARPTSLLLRYREDGFNCLHQDLYGEVAFPFQLVVLLSDPQRDFTGGEFLLVEQRPRQQSRGEAIALGRGDALIFPNRERPIETARGVSRAQIRHGLSRVRSGERLALGVIFHDAK